MRKEIELILKLFLVMVIALSFGGTAIAHSVELDPESLISMPYVIIGGNGTITINSSVTSYTLYYQAVQISSTVCEEMEKIEEDGEAELNVLDEELTEMETEIDNLEELYDSAYEAYAEGLKNTELSETELEELKMAYETAKTDYQNKINEYKNKVAEYNEKVAEFNSQIQELIPTYVEANWIQTTDGKISIDLTQFSGQQTYVVWVKLVTSDATYYDEGIYTATGTKEEDVDVTGVSLNLSTLSIETGSSYTLVATITPSDATDKTLNWSSSDESVATVSDGKVTAKSAGTATITVTTNDGDYTATCKVTVTEKANTTNSTNDVDNTTASGTLPQTGTSTIPIVLILGISILAVIFYKKYRYFNV